MVYMERSAPYTNQGGGTSSRYVCEMSAPTALTIATVIFFSSSKYQILGYGMNTNYSCELSSLLGKQQLFYELYLFDQVSSKSVPAPVRVINMYVGHLAICMYL